MAFKTAELCDLHAGSEHFQIAEPIFRSFGADMTFWGEIATLKTFEDTVLIRRMLDDRSGDQRVLVVDGGGSHRCALVDLELAQLAITRGWHGLVIYGCIRDSMAIAELPIGIRALHAQPLKGHDRGVGQPNTLISFAGVNFKTGHYAYADADGLIIAEERFL